MNHQHIITQEAIDFHALNPTPPSLIPPPSHTNRTTTTTLPLPSLSTHTHPHNDKTQHSQRALVRPAASGSVKEKVVLQTTRTSTYRMLMPEKSAIESMMPQGRSPEAKKGWRGVQ